MNKKRFLAISIGIIYVWFGMLKFFPTVSPAEELATETIYQLTFHLIPQDIGYIVLAVIEVLIGIGLMIPVFKRVVVISALCHMLMTFTPLFLFPDVVFASAPFGITIVGQYIMKNIVIIGALFMLLPARKNPENLTVSPN